MQAFVSKVYSDRGPGRAAQRQAFAFALFYFV